MNYFDIINLIFSILFSIIALLMILYLKFKFSILMIRTIKIMERMAMINHS